MGTQQFCLKWNNHQTNMLTVFDQLLSSEALVDVTLACEGLSLKAHKMVLSACSPFFQSLFLENPCKHPIVIMKDMKYTDLKAIVDFMYRGEVNVSQDQLSALLKTAETLKVKGLAEVTGDNRHGGPGGLVQQEIIQQHLVNTPQSLPASGAQTQHRAESPPLSRRKRGRPRRRSLSGSNRSDSEDQVPSKIKEPDSPEVIEEVTSEVESTNDARQRLAPSGHPQSQVSSLHSVHHGVPPLKSHGALPSQQDSHMSVEEPSGDEGDYDVEPSKLMEQTMTTENVPVFTDGPSQGPTLPPASTQLAIPTTVGLADTQPLHTGPGPCDSQALVPCSMPSEPSTSSCVSQDNNQDIKPGALVSFEEPPISPVAGPSHQDSSNSMMMYMDTSGVPAIPGPSSYQLDKQPSQPPQQQQPQEFQSKSTDETGQSDSQMINFSDGTSQNEENKHIQLSITDFLENLDGTSSTPELSISISNVQSVADFDSLKNCSTASLQEKNDEFTCDSDLIQNLIDNFATDHSNTLKITKISEGDGLFGPNNNTVICNIEEEIKKEILSDEEQTFDNGFDSGEDSIVEIDSRGGEQTEIIPNQSSITISERFPQDLMTFTNEDPSAEIVDIEPENHSEPVKLFMCYTCKTGFIHYYEFKKHILTHDTLKPFSCDICKKKFTRKNHLKDHSRLHTGYKPFKCESCNQSFRWKIQLTTHLRNHEEDKGNFKRLQQAYLRDKPFGCGSCHKRFVRKENLKEHVRIHTGQKPYKCEFCNQSFMWKNRLKTHQRTHMEENLFKCKICQMVFNEIESLKEHVNIHVEKETYTCNICNEIFTLEEDMRNHLETHSKRFKCDVCDKRFTHKGNLSKHVKMHTDEQLFKCEICNRKFNYKCNLKKHELIHNRSRSSKDNVRITRNLARKQLDSNLDTI